MVSSPWAHLITVTDCQAREAVAPGPDLGSRSDRGARGGVESAGLCDTPTESRMRVGDWSGRLLVFRLPPRAPGRSGWAGPK